MGWGGILSSIEHVYAMQVFCSVIFAPVVYFMVGFSPSGHGWRFFTFMVVGKYPRIEPCAACFPLREEREGNTCSFVRYGACSLYHDNVSVVACCIFVVFFLWRLAAGTSDPPNEGIASHAPSVRGTAVSAAYPFRCPAKPFFSTEVYYYRWQQRDEVELIALTFVRTF